MISFDEIPAYSRDISSCSSKQRVKNICTTMQQARKQNEKRDGILERSLISNCYLVGPHPHLLILVSLPAKGMLIISPVVL